MSEICWPSGKPAEGPLLDARSTCSAGDIAELAQVIFQRRGILRFQAGGRSMMPVLNHGETVLVGPPPAVGVKMGEVILARTLSGTVVVHRVVGRQKGGQLLTMGDNARSTDEPVAPGGVIGLVLAVERDGREVSLNGGFMRWLMLAYGRVKLLELGRNGTGGPQAAMGRGRQWPARKAAGLLRRIIALYSRRKNAG